MLFSEYKQDNRKATISTYGQTYTIDFYVNEKHIQKIIKNRIVEAEELAEEFVNGGTSPIFLTEESGWKN